MNWHKTEYIKQTAQVSFEQLPFDHLEQLQDSLSKIVQTMTESVLHSRSVDYDTDDPVFVDHVLKSVQLIYYAKAMNKTIDWEQTVEMIFNDAQTLADQLEPTQHPDDVAVDLFAAAMKAKLKKSREVKGRSGWEDANTISAVALSNQLLRHCDKGDPVDVANFCMMLHQRGERIIT